MAEPNYKEQGDKMIEWAMKVKCPKEVRIHKWLNIEDTTIFISTNIATMVAYPPGHRIWLLAYMRLYELKNTLTKTN